MPQLNKVSPFLIFFCIVSCDFFFSCNHHIANKKEQTCQPIPGLDSFLKPGQIILLGEIHGTKEGPHFIEQIVCHALRKNLSVIVGLELHQSEESVINSYLESTGLEADKRKVLQLPFWSSDYQDGRASRAMFALLESIRKLKLTKEKVGVLLIDDPNSDDRNFGMAQRIIEHANDHPSDFLIVLTGNYHNMIYENSGQMGSYVLEKLGKQRVLSLNQSYTGGSAWVDVAGEGFGPVGLRGNGRNEIGIFLDDNLEEYHGTLEMDIIHFSRPAKEILDN